MKRNVKKALIAWLIGLIVGGGLWYVIGESKNIGASLLFGCLIGLGMAGIFLFQQHPEAKK